MALGKTNAGAGVYNEGGLMPKPFVDRDRPRTNSRLIRGPHIDVPATEGLETDPVQNSVSKWMDYNWTHDHNTAAQGRVLVPKGHIIAFSDDGLIRFADYDSAGQEKYPIGLNYLNLFKPVRDRLASNRPTTSIRGFFELPVFASTDDAIAAGHKWGAVIASTDGLTPGDVLRVCGLNTDQPIAGPSDYVLGWFTNRNLDGSGKLGPYNGVDAQTMGIIAQVLEFDQGPVFDGLAEWVQFDNPFEYEFEGSDWLTGDTDRYLVRDPDSPTGYSFNPYPYDPRFQDRWWRDAMGIPNLSDGANWETVSSEKVVIPDTTAGPATVTVNFYYYQFASVGALLKKDGSPFANDVDEIYLEKALSSTLNGSTFNNAAITVTAVDDDGKGTVEVTLDITQHGDNTGGELDIFIKSKGQVAGVPANVDAAKCIGLARFQLLVR